MLSIFLLSLLLAGVECHPPHHHHQHARAKRQAEGWPGISPFHNTTTAQSTTTVSPDSISTPATFGPGPTYIPIYGGHDTPSEDGHASGGQSDQSGHSQDAYPSGTQGGYSVQSITEVDLTILINYLQGASSSNDQGEGTTYTVQTDDVPDLSGLDLSGLNLDGLDLSGLDLNNLDLTGDLSGSDLSGLISYLQRALSAADYEGSGSAPGQNDQSGNSQGSPQSYGSWQPPSQAWQSNSHSAPAPTPNPATWTDWPVPTTNPPSSLSSTFTRSSISTWNHSSTLTSVSSTSSSATPTPTPDSWANHTVTGYFGIGNVNIFPISKIPWQYLTHICYAFAKTQADNTITYDPDILGELTSEAGAHNVKVMLSIGGWGEGGTYFSNITSTNETIKTFVWSVQEVVEKYGLDGVDIDWEYVGNLNTLNDRPETDAAGYLEMLKQLKEAMPDAELTAAVSDNLFREEGDDGELHPVDMEPYIPYFTRLYLMNYDFWGVEQEEVANSGSNGALYPNPEEGQRNGKATTMLWHNNGKFPMDKLSYGVPFYGYGYNLIEDSDPETQGLYTTIKGKSRGSNDESVNSTSGYWGWRSLVSQEVVVKQDDGTYDAGDGWVRGYDNATQTPYIYNMEEVDGTVPQIISYDDPDSIRLKVEFAKANGMNGVMFWAMYGDTDEGELSAVLAEGRSTG